ncbi:DUF3604 domain-containing protein [Parahaliea aestuarii]|uniref:DUF3604 domain-containing protein n=1 Tax=Parahaliea aestuarii TaxID=1852021 RepID=A0A5C8ZSU9_9GAMM|nr:DUF3604 domain-containing protein [Parahaliea aestuarii]TXS91495.1 DUF3604 domain-containing protein [Parahaliea aestuarii]
MRQVIGLCTALSISAAVHAQPQLLWGDTHLHTSYSSDAFANNNLVADPDTAYRYARGEPVEHPYHKARVQIGAPLDFLVVSDHAEFLGVINHTYFTGVDTADLGLLDALKARFAAWVLQRRIGEGEGRQLFVDVLPEPGDAREAAKAAQLGGQVGWLPPMDQVESSTWRSIIETADRFNDPGEFTAFIGWEWSSIPGGANLHRVVISNADANQADAFEPFGLDDSPYPEDLWAWLDSTSEETGVDFLAIPHNSNISKGYMFDTRSLRGDPFDADYVATRRRWEPIAEITQLKGDSETHPDLSPDDPFAAFEEYPHYIQRWHTPYKAEVGDYLRPTLLRGMQLAAELGSNPYELGFIGSTDAHTGLSTAEEDNFHGKFATDSIPANKMLGWSDEEGGTNGWAMSASGMAAVWAEDNSRDAIMAAMKRREVYATTGPRIALQFFGGWQFVEDQLQSPVLYQEATATGVPMGGVLPAATAGGAPTFLVQALKDPAGVGLERVQIVKGWLNAAGEPREQVFDVVWSGERSVGSDGRLPAPEARIDRRTGKVAEDEGAAQLLAYWQDPDFNPGQSAFYYVRVLQVPTARHSYLDALALGQEEAGGYPDTLQERAYSSPIWYRPAN